MVLLELCSIFILAKRHAGLTAYTFSTACSVQLQGRKGKTCIGSLVSPDFVLTAAHCFTFGDLPADIVVEIEDGLGSKGKYH